MGYRAAFDSWSDNHPTLKFIDVTNECVATGLLTNGTNNLNATCPLASIWLTTAPDTPTPSTTLKQKKN